jgi:Fe2+ or Zn2+ uptake regulation protein
MSVYKQLRPLLVKAGLNDAEIVVYSNLLKEPAANMWEVIQRTGLARSTAYHAMNRLMERKIVKKDKHGLHALTLKKLVESMKKEERKNKKTMLKIKKLAPFLHMNEVIMDDFEMLFSLDDIKEAYMFMAEHSYDVNLDFGDYESFITTLGDPDIGFKFREKRAEHATHHAICTTFGPNLKEFCTKEDLESFRNRFDVMNDLNFKDHWVIFSDNSDYVMFNDASDPDFPSAVLVRSKSIAEVQRMQFKQFSKML